MCEELAKNPADRSASMRALLLSDADPRLRKAAAAFVQLQEAREGADYDLSITITQSAAEERVQLAGDAAQWFAQVRDLPETRLFLAALLLVDHFTRRG
ncbi:MAG: hypothetical protein NVSMB18_24480 [Acetobacteraceae bacterium]